MNTKKQFSRADYAYIEARPASQSPTKKYSVKRYPVFFFLLLAAFLVFSLLLNPTAHAQTLDKKRLAAISSVINSLLLDEGIFAQLIELSINGYDATTYAIKEDFEVIFPRSNQDLEFCFVLSSASNLQLSVNGVNHSLRTGENCVVISKEDQPSTNILSFSYSGVASVSRISSIGVTSNSPSRSLLPSVTRSKWDERAVRKVLKIFAFGGHARDAQIRLWANMRPYDAIRQMLTFAEHNPLLSPLAVGETYKDTALSHGTLEEFLDFISDSSSNIPIPQDSRGQFHIEGYSFDDGYNRIITVRGLNPFRHKIGFWETNYHLAVNVESEVSQRQIVTYYDQILEAHEAGLPYKDVMGVAAKSAAVAMQYGHRDNKWNDSDQECECNQDFAREIHQLYYGIFGEGDPNHEDTTIPETAKLLTDMEVEYIREDDNRGFTGFDTNVTFETDDHHVDPVTIFGNSISGANASIKIDRLMPLSMQHPESLKNLPVMIISVLADDNLSESGKNLLRASWASMGVNRKLLDFIHAYAISDLFHSQNQFKYLTTHERALYLANKHNIDNLEAYFGGAYYDGGRAGRTIGSVINEDFAGDFFRPTHNVFGGQTSSEASDSALAFENNYNRLTDEEHHLRDAVACDNCDLGFPWQKKWETVLPKRANGQFYVSDVAEWLWKHAVGNMDNYTELERAHLYSLLGAAINDPGSNSDGDHAFDFNLVMCVVADHAYDPQFSNTPAGSTITDILATNRWDDFCRQNDDDTTGFLPHELAELNATYTGAQIASSSQIQAILTELGNQTIPLNAYGPQHANNGANLRTHARERVSSALGFIFTTPFIFAEGQQ
ncbi:MAG: DUF1800 family protein [Acidiferrobacterales bacterium]|nr:DUF1800 family protein [Acidiferrobacterales bacterium]